MQTSSIANAIKQICNEKGISYESVVATISVALAAAYKKDFGQKNQNIRMEFDPETGGMKAFDVKTVVTDELAAKYEEEKLQREEEEENRQENFESREEGGKDENKLAPGKALGDEEKEIRFNPKTDVSLSDAQFLKPGAILGEEIKIELEIPGDFGRMAAQTAKQVITQRLREAEKETIFQQFKEKEHLVLMGVVQRVEHYGIFLDLGRATAILPREYQIPRERYIIGERLRVYVVSVGIGSRGAEIIVSRTDPEIVKELFTTEIPEVASGAIEIKAIAREAGSRSKVAVYTEQENIDPIGSCVGQRGTRVQTIISELSGEKIDIIAYDETPALFIKNALLPAKVQDIVVHEEEKSAKVTIHPDQLSLAIGREGQNVRLASRLTGWKISIVGAEEPEKDGQKETVMEKDAKAPEEDKPEPTIGDHRDGTNTDNEEKTANNIDEEGKAMDKKDGEDDQTVSMNKDTP